MADDLLGLGKVCEALEKGTKEVRELAKAYFDPIAKEKGELRADKIRLERMHQAFKTMEEADRLLQKAGIKHRRLNQKIVIPLLEHASLETDEQLAIKWAGLLASSVSDDSVHASFPGILADLTFREVKILDKLFTWSSHWEKTGTWEQSAHTMNKLRDQLGLSREEFRIPVENLLRLRLCTEDSAWGLDAVFDRDSEVHLLLTALGKSFVEACNGPSKSTTSNDARDPRLEGLG